MAWSAALGLLLVPVAWLPTALAHSTFEAQELETHVLNDEGSDLIDSYGGYDLNELYLGAAHLDSAGAGPQGDALYLRIEAYGLPGDTTKLMPWSLTVAADTPAGPLTRTLSTADGFTFTSDFDALQVEVEAPSRELHIERALILLGKAGLHPGDVLGNLRMESRYGNDLRDVAPGGIPAPGTNGLAPLVDPTEIPGQGTLIAAPRVPDVAAYFGSITPAAHRDSEASPTHYSLTVPSALLKGGQHISLAPRTQDGWNYTPRNASAVAESGATVVLSFDAQAQPGTTAPLVVDVQSDVGGRTDVTVHPDGTLSAQGIDAAAPAPVRASPGAAPVAALAVAVAAALVLRRR